MRTFACCCLTSSLLSLLYVDSCVSGKTANNTGVAANKDDEAWYVRTLRGHTGPVTHLAFNPSCKSLISADQSRVLHWDISSKDVVTPQSLLAKDQAGIAVVAVSRDSKFVAVGCANGAIEVWETAKAIMLSRVGEHPHGITALCFSPDAQLLTSAGYDRTVRLWSIRDQTCKRTLRTIAPALSMEFLGTGKQLAAACGYQNITNLLQPDDQLVIWDPDSGREVSNVALPTFSAWKCLAIPGTDLLVTTGTDSTVSIWDSGRVKQTLTQRAGQVGALACSPDGRILAVANSHLVTLWELRTGKRIHVLDGHEGHTVSSIAFSHDGKILATGGFDKKITLWDLPTVLKEAPMK